VTAYRAEGLSALAHPTRREIFERIADRPRPVGEIARELPVSRPAVSQHLKVLKDAGLVTVRQRARQRLYRLRPDPLREIDTWLTPFREAWNDRLDALETHLDTMEEA
jgi:DNA-binding transcriptional ArsR family regulator